MTHGKILIRKSIFIYKNTKLQVSNYQNKDNAKFSKFLKDFFSISVSKQIFIFNVSHLNVSKLKMQNLKNEYLFTNWNNAMYTFENKILSTFELIVCLCVIYGSKQTRVNSNHPILKFSFSGKNPYHNILSTSRIWKYWRFSNKIKFTMMKGMILYFIITINYVSVKLLNV